jgi:hypothetical protein
MDAPSARKVCPRSLGAPLHEPRGLDSFGPVTAPGGRISLVKGSDAQSRKKIWTDLIHRYAPAGAPAGRHFLERNREW